MREIPVKLAEPYGQPVGISMSRDVMNWRCEHSNGAWTLFRVEVARAAVLPATAGLPCPGLLAFPMIRRLGSKVTATRATPFHAPGCADICAPIRGCDLISAESGRRAACPRSTGQTEGPLVRTIQAGYQGSGRA